MCTAICTYDITASSGRPQYGICNPDWLTGQSGYALVLGADLTPKEYDVVSASGSFRSSLGSLTSSSPLAAAATRAAGLLESSDRRSLLEKGERAMDNRGYTAASCIGTARDTQN